MRSPFPEPMVPVGGNPGADDSRALAALLMAYAAAPEPRPLADFEAFAAAHPQSPWLASLRLNLGIVRRERGYFHAAAADWEAAWNLSKDVAGSQAAGLAALAMAERIQLLAWVGRPSEMDVLFAEFGDRPCLSRAGTKMQAARDGREVMEQQPAIAFKCGPYALDALHRILKGAGNRHDETPQVRGFAVTARGTHLVELTALAKTMGLDLMPVKRIDPAAPLAVPAVLHWKLDHYSALVADRGAIVAITDATMDPFYGKERVIDRAALDAEWSGYALIPAGPMPLGYESVPDAVAATIHGKGFTAPPVDASSDTGCDAQAGGQKNGCGMMGYSFHLLKTALRISDRPLPYEPVAGPWTPIEIVYAEKMAGQTQTPTISNMGPKWGLSVIQELDVGPPNGGYSPYLLFGTGGWNYFRSSGTAQIVEPNGPTTTAAVYVNAADGGTFRSPFHMYWNSANQWTYYTWEASVTVRYPDGSSCVYSNNNMTTTRYVPALMTDPAGRQTTFRYAPGTKRLDSITDATGVVTTFQYATTNNLLITGISQNVNGAMFAAYITYDTLGRLSSVTDAIGMVSSVTYEGNTDRVVSMTTPYGTTSFNRPNSTSIEAVDPAGDRERIERVNAHGVLPASEPGGTEPEGGPWDDGQERQRDIYYWDRKAMKLGFDTVPVPAGVSANRYANAVNYQFLRAWYNPSFAGAGFTGISRLLQSIKHPFGSRQRFLYDREPGNTTLYTDAGIRWSQPTGMVTVGEGGQTVKVSQTLDGHGRPLVATDAVGRQTRHTWNDNGDLIRMEQRIQANPEVFAPVASWTYGSGVTSRLPLTAVDASGNETRYAYDALGRLTSIDVPGPGTPARLVTRLGYGAPSGAGAGDYLRTITQPSGVIQVTYDAAGRVATVTDIEGRTTSLAYDLLNRVVRTNYPDGTNTQVVWDKLDPVKVIDRSGLVSERRYNALGQMIAVIDAAGLVTQFAWCKCGKLQELIDPAGNRTAWSYDVGGRLLAKIFPDGSRESYGYDDYSQRLRSVTDALNQTRSVTYTKDGRPSGIQFANALNPTPNVSVTYDPYWPRVFAVVQSPVTTASGGNAIGTFYRYRHLGTPGALGVAEVTEKAMQNGSGVMIAEPTDWMPTTRAAPGPKQWLNRVTIIGTETHVTGYVFKSTSLPPGYSGPPVVYQQWYEVVSQSSTESQTSTFLSTQPANAAMQRDMRLQVLAECGPMFHELQRRAGGISQAVTTAMITSNDPIDWHTETWKSLVSAPPNGVEVRGRTYDSLVRHPAAMDPEIVDPDWIQRASSYDAMVAEQQVRASTQASIMAWITDFNNFGTTTSTVAYGYNLQGVPTMETVNGVTTRNLQMDGLGRITSVADAIGTSTMGYVGTTGRLASVNRGNLSTILSYAGVPGDPRLVAIQHAFGGVVRMRDDLTYGGDRQISGWRQRDSAGTTTDWSFGYDAIGQIATAVPGNDVSKAEAYAYDRAGNRILSQRANQASSITFNANNQISAGGPASTAMLVGSTDEAALVTVNGVPVLSDANRRFRALVPANTPVTVAATDGNGNVSSRRLRVDVTSPALIAPTYDANGNTLSDGVRTYAWDAANRIVRITDPRPGFNRRTLMSYDAFGRRARVTEINQTTNATISDKRCVWVGSRLVEERNWTTNAVLRRFAPSGFEIVSGVGVGKYWYLRDHLGSVRAVVDMAGNVRAEYRYSPWGERTKLRGDLDTPEGFTGHWHHESGLVLTWFRGYDPTSGRWLSRDPIGESGGINLYGYVGNGPVGRIDRLGLDIIYLLDVDSRGALGNGHSGVLVGNDRDGWDYFSYSPLGMKKMCFNTLSSAIRDPEVSRYEKGLRYFTSPFWDKYARSLGRDPMWKPYLYQPSSNHCGHAASALMRTAGVDFVENSWAPNKRYNDNVNSADIRGPLQNLITEPPHEWSNNGDSSGWMFAVRF